VLWPSFLPLFTQVRGRCVLRTSALSSPPKLKTTYAPSEALTTTKQQQRYLIWGIPRPLYNSRNRIGGAHLSADLVEQLQVYDAWVSTNEAEVLVRFEFSKMTDEEAQEIARWRYVPPYDFYDSISDPDDLAELLDPRQRGDDYFSALDEKGALVGFFQFKRDGNAVVEVGLGCGRT
jgi:hypothetical protein